MMLHVLNDVANDVESTKNRKLRHYPIASLKSETIGKLINRIPGILYFCASSLRYHMLVCRHWPFQIKHSFL